MEKKLIMVLNLGVDISSTLGFDIPLLPGHELVRTPEFIIVVSAILLHVVEKDRRRVLLVTSGLDRDIRQLARARLGPFSADSISDFENAQVITNTNVMIKEECIPRINQLMICRAPSLPRTPGSCGFGLLSRPFLRLRKESIPLLVDFPLPLASNPSAGRVAL